MKLMEILPAQTVFLVRGQSFVNADEWILPGDIVEMQCLSGTWVIAMVLAHDIQNDIYSAAVIYFEDFHRRSRMDSHAGLNYSDLMSFSRNNVFVCTRPNAVSPPTFW